MTTEHKLLFKKIDYKTIAGFVRDSDGNYVYLYVLKKERNHEGDWARFHGTNALGGHVPTWHVYESHNYKGEGSYNSPLYIGRDLRDAKFHSRLHLNKNTYRN